MAPEYPKCVRYSVGNRWMKHQEGLYRDPKGGSGDGRANVLPYECLAHHGAMANRYLGPGDLGHLPPHPSPLISHCGGGPLGIGQNAPQPRIAEYNPICLRYCSHSVLWFFH